MPVVVIDDGQKEICSMQAPFLLAAGTFRLNGKADTAVITAIQSRRNRLPRFTTLDRLIAAESPAPGCYAGYACLAVQAKIEFSIQ